MTGKSRIQNEKRKKLRAEARAARIIIKKEVAATAVLSEAKARANAEKCKRYRDNKFNRAAAASLIAIQNLRVLRSEVDSLSREARTIDYEEEPNVAVMPDDGKGNGLLALKDILPATTICAYGGKRIDNEATVRDLLLNGKDKIIQVKDKNIWYDGDSSTTVAPMVNHACDCTANCIFTYEGDLIMLCSKADSLGFIKAGSWLTVDYNYGDPYSEDKEGQKIRNDPHLIWYVDYIEKHRNSGVCKLI